MSIYADVLGSSVWKVLPDSVRHLHETGGEGTFRIERRRIARFLPFLPPAGEKISIHLRIVRSGDEERWFRTFDGVHVYKSLQRATQGGAIHERIGPLTIKMTLAASAEALRYHLIEVRFLGLMIPFRWLPRVVASELAEGPFVRVVVRIGDVFNYSGLVHPR